MAYIFKRLKYYISVGRYSLKLQIQRQMEYPSFLFGWLISNPLQFILGLLAIKVVISNFGSLNGWEFNEVAFLYGISVVSHGISIVLFIQTWYLQWLVINGEFDRLLLRPMNVFYQFVVMDFNLIGITDFIPGIFILIYGIRGVGFDPTLFNIFKLLVILTGATLIRGGVYLASSSVAFWTKSSNAFVEVNMRLFDYTSFYPLTIYPLAIQTLFTFLLPLGFISFYPAAEFLNKDTGLIVPNHLWLWTLIIGIVMYAVAQFIFKKGLHRYESAGS